MRVKTVRTASRSALLAAGVWLVCHAPSALGGASGGVLTTAAFDYAALALLTQAAFPKVRRADLTKALMAFAASLEGLRALVLWHGDAIVLLEAMGAVAAIHALSFIEQFRAGARRDPESAFSVAHPGNRRAGRRRSAPPRPEAVASAAAP